MPMYRSSIRLLVGRAYRPGLGLLALLWLAACGVTEQSAAAVTPAPARPTSVAPATRASAASTDVQSLHQEATASRPAAPQTTYAADLRHVTTTDALRAVTAPAVATVAPTQTSEAAMNEPTAENVPPTQPAPTEPAPAAAPAPVAWQSYRNQQAGYSVEYPASWTASEQDQGNGALSVTFAPGDGGSSITVITQAGEILMEAGEIPNTRCQEITVGGLPARRCTDTISFTTTTTVAGHGQTYIITTISKRLDMDTHQHFLDSFTITP
jgi:hypothetical protein